MNMRDAEVLCEKGNCLDFSIYHNTCIFKFRILQDERNGCLLVVFIILNDKMLDLSKLKVFSDNKAAVLMKEVDVLLAKKLAGKGFLEFFLFSNKSLRAFYLRVVNL